MNDVDFLHEIAEELEKEFKVTGWTEDFKNGIILALKDCYDYGKDYGWQYDMDAYIESKYDTFRKDYDDVTKKLENL